MSSDPGSSDTFPEPDPVEASPASFSRLQQQLIELRAERDREIAQLVRLNQVVDDLLGGLGGEGLEPLIAEAIVDVLDLGVGAVWVVPDDPQLPVRHALHGLPGSAARWPEAGRRLVQRFRDQSSRRAQWLTPADRDALPVVGVESAGLIEGLACWHPNARCHLSVLLVAANTAASAALAAAISDDSLEVLGLLAAKVSALLEAEADRQLIQAQVRQLTQSEERLMSVLRGTTDGWWDLDLTTDICFLSSRCIAMLSGDRPEQTLVEAPFWADRILAEDRDRFEILFAKALRGETSIVEMELRMRTDEGTDLPVEIRGTLFRDRDGRPLRFSGSIQDLTERKSQEDRIYRLAYYDSLTNLANRRLLNERLESELSLSWRSSQLCAVMLLDLDNFKVLNDTRGHAAGDQLLAVVARRLANAVRANDLVARLGGDEFVVLLTRLGVDEAVAAGSAEGIGRKLIEVLSRPIQLDVGEIHQTVSIGIALAGSDVGDPQRLLQRADVALYQAKDAGRNTVALFHPVMQERLDRRTSLQAQLRQGLSSDCFCDRFKVAYQLQCDSDGAAVGAEVLLRWQAEGGVDLADPAEFIPLAEESGLIHRLSGCVLQTVLEDMARWQSLLPDDFRVSVNVSATEFQDPSFPHRLLDRLERSGVSAERVRLEITEKLVLRDLDAAGAVTRFLVDRGLQVSLDDFGTGYSSFAYLRSLPIQEVKIDQSFVGNCLVDAPDQVIVRAIIGLARSMGLRVVAEGVETAEQLLWLQSQGCDVFQGFFFDRPSSERERPLLERMSSGAWPGRLGR